jgi:hypothetical protein
MFGEDPYICSVDVPLVSFGAWDYAREQSIVLCTTDVPPDST